ncbi:MAG TPA: hypothetical protein DIT09_00795 [Glutamicibacter sp.]|uniref:hypothetical protein n=1 Tax=Glutamicibacter arilaitensis TaxID=256701 RepID=UPI000EC0DE4C|nr:hypothetical protein [Glutamicibacter sp.]
MDEIVSTGGTVSWITGEGDDKETHTEALVLSDGEPTRAEIEAYSAPWSGNAKKMREIRAEKSAKSADSGETEAVESAPVDDSVALSFNDLVVKLKEVENTINALKMAGVELTDSEREIASNIIADMSASL